MSDTHFCARPISVEQGNPHNFNVKPKGAIINRLQADYDGEKLLEMSHYSVCFLQGGTGSNMPDGK